MDLKDLEEGWYWLSNPNEGDLFYPVYVNAHNEYVYDGRHFPVEDLIQVNYVKAVMPNEIGE